MMSAQNTAGPAHTGVRALHVFGALNRGGAETWLMDVMRHSDRTRLEIDVCLVGSGEGAYESEFRSLGGTILRCPLKGNPIVFYRSFRRLLSQYQFDVVHAHVYFFSGVVLRAASMAGVRQRIAHIHPIEDLKQDRSFRALYRNWMRRWIVRYGTHFVAPTKEGLGSFWGKDWSAQGDKRPIYNGIQVTRFAACVDPAEVRSELGLPVDAKIVITVARFAPHKRHDFLVQVAERLIGRDESVYFVLIGAGPLRDAIISQVVQKGLGDRFRFVAGAPDIDRFWLSADAFAFPSCNEGFGIAVVEAAAAGLPVVAQDIPGVREAATACHDIALLPLDTDAEAWSKVLEAAVHAGRLKDEARTSRLEDFPFTIERSIAALETLYEILPLSSDPSK